MAEFDFPEWRQGPEPPAADLPPPEYAEADAVREQQLNDQYLAGQRQILNLGENAYYRQQGEAAIHAAPPALEALQQLKDNTLAQAGNDRQRGALRQRLDWHRGEAARGIFRHLAGQTEAWQTAVADNQVKTAEEEAALSHNDAAKVELLAAGAYSTRLRSAGQPPESEAAQASAAEARSSVYRRAIEATLAAGDNRSAVGLYDRAKDQLTAGDAGPVQGQMKAVTQRQTAQNYLAGLLKPTPGEPSAFFDAPKQLSEADAAHRAATLQNEADWSHDPDQRAINQHYVDVQFGGQKQEIAQAKRQLDNAVSTWVATPRPNGQPQTDLPPPALWAQLGPQEQQNVLAWLKRNAFGPDASNGPAQDPSIARAQASGGDVQLAQTPPRPPREPGATEPSPVEQLRIDAYNNQLRNIQRLDPSNRELSGIFPRGWAPGQRDVDRAGREVDTLQRRLTDYQWHRQVLQDIDPANPLLRSNPEPGRAPSEEAASRMIAEIRPIIRRNSEAVVYSNGALIGQPGRRDEVRLLPGGVADAQQLFNSLTRLGYRQVFVLTGQYSSGGTFVELPGGGTVGLRINNAGLPTVDVNVPGVPPVRYHFVK